MDTTEIGKSVKLNDHDPHLAGNMIEDQPYHHEIFGRFYEGQLDTIL